MLVELVEYEGMIGEVQGHMIDAKELCSLEAKLLVLICFGLLAIAERIES